MNELKAISILFSVGFVDAELLHKDNISNSISIYRRAVNIAKAHQFPKELGAFDIDTNPYGLKRKEEEEEG